MASKQFYHDIDLVAVGQLINARLQNVDNAGMAALAATLGAGNTGLVVYNTEQSQQFNWDGTKFDPVQVDVAGDIVFKGVVDATAGVETQTVAVNGYQYVVTVGGVVPTPLTIGAASVAVVGDTNADGAIDVEAGDILLFVDVAGTGADVAGTQSTVADTLYVIQRNTEQATDVAIGSARLATQAEATAGVVDNAIVTPETMGGALVANKYVKQYYGTVDLTANTPANIAHGLNLTNPAAFMIDTLDSTGKQFHLEVNAVDSNTVSVTSLLDLTGVQVTIQGASTVYPGV